MSEDLRRTPSGALINTNEAELRKYKKQRAQMERISKLEKEVGQLKAMVMDLHEALKEAGR